jgi:hypothetical protein
VLIRPDTSCANDTRDFPGLTEIRRRAYVLAQCTGAPEGSPQLRASHLLRTWPYVAFARQVGHRSSFAGVSSLRPQAVEFGGIRAFMRGAYGIGRLLTLCHLPPVGRGVFPIRKILPRRDGFSSAFTHCEVESHTSGEPSVVMVERPDCSYDGRCREYVALTPLLSQSRVRQFAKS